MSILSKVSTSDAVVEYFRAKILNKDLLPGDQLESERILQKKFEISRFALREGLAKLSALGLIAIRHGKGAFVSEDVNLKALSDVLIPLHPSCERSTNNLLEARMFLEGELNGLACLRKTPEGMNALRKNIEETESHLDDLVAFCRCDLDFHRLIAQMADNQFLFNMHTVLCEHILPVMLRNADSRENRESILDRHRQLFSAISDGDSEKTRNLSIQFLKLGTRNYL